MSSLNDTLLKFNPDTLVSVRKSYDLDEAGKIEALVDLLKQWTLLQKHFVKKDFSPQYLERILIAAKGSVEKAKTRLDKICTFKTLMPQFFGDVHAENYFEYLTGKIIHVTLPQMTPENDRIIIAKYIGKDFSSKMVLDGSRCCVMHAEYIRAHDYAAAYIVLIDLREASLPHFVTSINILDLRKFATIVIEGYGMRVKGIHLITESKMVEVLVGIGKQVLPEKIKKRINVHKNAESLHNAVHRNILPEDLGGDDKSIMEMNEDWMRTLSSDEFRSYWRDAIKACTDESKRDSNKFNEEYMGLPGSVRKLTVD